MVKATCPKCGRDTIRKHGTTHTGKQRWSCYTCKYRTTRLNTGDKKPAQIQARDLPKSNRYVITCAQNATLVHQGFLRNLLAYCRHTGAELLVVPIRYRNPTSILVDRNTDIDWWHPAVLPYLHDQRSVLNPNLTLLADIKTRPTAARPLSGFESITGGTRSGIIAHPKIEMRTIATQHGEQAKVMVTTGAVTRKNYTESKEGAKGAFHHVFGALVVELDSGGVFHLRHLIATESGDFQDLDVRVRGGEVTGGHSVAALVMGDTHVDFVDPSVTAATFGRQGIVQTLNPKYLVWHDLVDFYSRSHHHRKRALMALAKWKGGRSSVYAEVQRAFGYIDKHSPPGCTNVLVPSNHNEHLGRWVEENSCDEDPENLEFRAETWAMMVKTARATMTGSTWEDPFVWWGRRLLKTKDRTVFLRRGESFLVQGIEVGVHGDRGVGGSPGTLMQYARMAHKCVIGHSHTPGIIEGAYQVGTSSYLTRDYNVGAPSGWLQTHCVIYPNGKRTLVNIIGGRWRLP